ncbi:MAG: hypothetical protein ABI142_13295, partial [Bryocella sp.]
MTDEDPIMNEAQAGDAVARYLEEHPELLQDVVPEHDLWPAIENRISARVIPIAAAGVPKVRRAGGSMRWIPMLIAASALVASTAGITYLVTERGGGAESRSGANVQVANTGTSPGTTANDDQNATRNTGVPPAEGAQTQPAQIQQAQANPERTDTRQSEAQPSEAQLKSPAAQLAAHSSGPAQDRARETYDTEIASLHTMLESRRSHLNPETVDVIEKNLQVIDDAIRQSREALAKDPNSRLLNDQLDRTLAQKTGLL